MAPRRFWFIASLIVLGAFALHWPALGMALVWDDLNSLSPETDALGCLSGPAACLTHTAGAHYYRPLFGVSMVASFEAFGASLERAAAPMHAENLAWFGLELAMVLALARRVFGATDPRGLVTLALMAFHPIQNAAVTWVTGRADTLPLIALLATTLLLLSGRAALATLAFAVAVFTKEQAAAMVVAAPWLMAGSFKAKRTVVFSFLAVVAAWLFCAKTLLPSSAVNAWPGSPGEHAKLVIRTLAHFVASVIAPSGSSLHRLTAAPWSELEPWEWLVALGTAVLWLGLGVTAFVRAAGLRPWWLWATGLVAPVMNVVPLSLALSTHRYVLSLFGLAMAAGFGFGALAARLKPRIAWFVAVGASVGLALVTWVDQPSWASNGALAAAVLEADPDNVEWLLAASSELNTRGRASEALALLDRAVAVYYPGTATPDERLDMVRRGLGARHVAEHNSLGRAPEAARWLAGPLCLRGQLLGESGRLAEAIDDVTTCIEVYWQGPWHEVLVKMLRDANRLGEARASAADLVRRAPSPEHQALFESLR